VNRISSGNVELDRVLGGGFPPNSINLVMGMPGTGKTVLAQHLAFSNATPEARVLYFSTVSEPLDKILRYVQGFSFFDPEKIGDSVIYADLSETLRSEGLAAAIDVIVDDIKEHGPRFLVVDSFKALHSFADDEREFRSCLTKLTAALSSLAVTSFLVGEYSAGEAAKHSEFAVVDGVLELVLQKVGVRDIRYLRVTKLRGSDFMSGEHAFRISADGLAVFPRVAAPSSPVPYEVAATRMKTGVDALDAMVDEGYWKGGSTVVFGPPGSGKTLLGLHFVFKGIEMGEPGVIATLQENPTQLRRVVAGFGWDLEEAIDSGMLRLHYVSPVGVYLDEFVHQVAAIAQAEGSQRVLIDSINDLQMSSPDTERFRDYLYSLTQSMSSASISLFMTQEVRDLFATTVLSEYGVSHMSDNVLLINYVHEGADIVRTLAVIKTRGSRHDSRVRRFTIDSEGIRIGDPIAIDSSGQYGSIA
jgi:circadian clock protein KaiC